MDPQRELLRHAVATLAYRGGKVIRDAPATFGAVRIQDETRSAVEILSHIVDVLEFAACAVNGTKRANRRSTGAWADEVTRFFQTLSQLDDALARAGQSDCRPERLLQGPIADALTHIGQLATLRRVVGSPVRGENYFEADIVAGRVGPDQMPPSAEFD